jgi:Ca-activated chloride channel homolog
VAVVSVEGAGRFESQFAARTDVVEVYATVLDSRGEPVQGLSREAFTVLEDDQRQAITVFAAGTVPLTLAVAVDRSWSMAGDALAIARHGAAAAVDRLADTDGCLVLAIGSRVETVAGVDAGRAGQRRAIERLAPWGTSPLADGIVAAVEAIDSAIGRRALLIWSDGRERFSEASHAEAVEAVRQSRVLVYPVAVRGPVPGLLTEVAELSGGRAVAAGTRADAERASATIVGELRHQYLLGYEPDRSKAPGWRRITVRVEGESLQVRTRQGYSAR